MTVVRGGGAVSGGAVVQIPRRTYAALSGGPGLPYTPWDCSATITGTARMSTDPPSMTWSATANIIGRAYGYAHAEQPTPPAALSPYGGLST